MNQSTNGSTCDEAKPQTASHGADGKIFHRGLFRVWVLVSAGWVMSWAIYLLMYALQGRFPGSEFLVVPILLFGPPVALLIFGVATGWAFRGFQVENHPAEE